MSKKGIVADFDKIKAEIEAMKAGDFNELRYFFEIRKLYGLLQALFTGGAMAVNSDVMGKVPMETLDEHFNMLIQMVYQVCEMAYGLRQLSEQKAPSSEEESKEVPPEILGYEEKISYVA